MYSAGIIKMALTQRIVKSKFYVQVFQRCCLQQECRKDQGLAHLHLKSGAEYSSQPLQQWIRMVSGNFQSTSQGICCSSQRAFSQVPWVWPLGKIDHPKKKDFKEQETAALVQLGDISPQSLTYLERLHDAASSSEVLDVVQVKAADAITTVHYGTALRRLAEIHTETRQKAVEEGLVPASRGLVLYDSKFKDLCRIVLQESRHMDNLLFLEVLDALHRLRVPLKSSMMYTFLAQAEQRLNTFQAAELAQYAGILDRLDKRDPRVGALLDAVRILAPRHVGDLRTLPQVLLLIDTVGTTLDGVSRGKLANMLLAILAVDEERALDDVVHTVLALRKMDYRLDMLLELACATLTQNVHKLAVKELHVLVCALGSLGYPDKGFFTAASECILEKMEEWELVQLIDIVEAFCSVKIKSPLLLDSVVKRVMESKEGDLSLNRFTTLMRSIADFDQRPPASWNFLDFVCATVGQLLSKLSQPSSCDCMDVVSLANSFASLGIFSEGLLEFAASRKFANGIMMIKDVKEYRTVIRNMQILTDQLEGKELGGTEPRDALLKNLLKLIPER